MSEIKKNILNGNGKKIIISSKHVIKQHDTHNQISDIQTFLRQILSEETDIADAIDGKLRTLIQDFINALENLKTNVKEPVMKKETQTLPTSQCTSKSVNPPQDTSKSVNPPQDTSKSVNPPQDTSKSVNPTQDTSKSVNPPQDTSKSVNPPQDTSKSVNPPQDTSKSVNPPQDTSKSVNPPQDTSKSVNPPQDTSKSVNPPQDTSKSVNPPQDTTVNPPQDFRKPMEISPEETKDFMGWGVGQLATFLHQNGIPEKVVEILTEEKVEGKHIPRLSAEILMAKGISFQECLSLQEIFEELTSTSLKSKVMKVYNDPIHGHIEVNPACQAIIDTPIFQRLRFIKQLGMVYYIYPGAAHNRFEHSLGVYYLAGKFARQLQNNQPELNITDKDILCVEIAGLCHDIGHGPFSHVFDKVFLPTININTDLNHEKVAVQLLDEIYVLADLSKYGIDETDKIFIKEMIGGPMEIVGSQGWPYRGRKEDKSFLYEIVCNKRNCIDVNKWDSLARDCHHLGFNINFDYKRFMMFAKVIDYNGEMQICVRDKEISNLYNMFHTRYTLHKFAYQQKVNCGLEIMLTDALILADKHVKFIGTNGKEHSISSCITDIEAYHQLTDNVLFKILYDHDSDTASDSELNKAREIIHRIFKRDLYTCVWEKQTTHIMRRNEKTNLEESIETFVLQYKKKDSPLDRKDLVAKIVFMDFGMREVNPIQNLKVYSKKTPNQARHFTRDETSRILTPVAFVEMEIRVYSKTSDIEKRKTIADASETWYRKWQSDQIKQKQSLENFSIDNIDFLINDFLARDIKNKSTKELAKQIIRSMNASKHF